MRLFIATSFPQEVMADLNARVARFKIRLPSASWVKPSSQHLTFAFLGEHPESAVAALTGPLDATLAKLPSFAATLHGCGFFPNSRHARVGWVGLDPEAPFVETARAVREAVTMSGVSFDVVEFKPHLTLMRIRD